MCNTDDQMLRRYLSGELSETEEFALCERIATDRQLAERLWVWQHLGEHFDEEWASWTAQTHGRAEVHQATAAPREPIIEEPAHRGAAAVHLLVDGVHRLAGAVADALPAAWTGRLCPAVTGVGSAERVEQVLRTQRQVAGLLAEGKTSEAAALLGRIQAISARAAEAASVELTGPSGERAWVTVDGRSRRVSVRYWPSEGIAPPRRADLQPSDPHAEARSAPLEPVAYADYLLAEFADVSDGPHVLRLVVGPAQTDNREES